MLPSCKRRIGGSIPSESTTTNNVSSSSTYGTRISGFHPEELGSIPNEDATIYLVVALGKSGEAGPL